MIAANHMQTDRMDVSSWLSSAARLLKRGKTDEFRDALTIFLADIPYDARPSLKAMEMNEMLDRYISVGDKRINFSHVTDVLYKDNYNIIIMAVQDHKNAFAYCQ